MPTTFYDRYRNEILPTLKSELGTKNVMATPRVTKVKVSVGFGKIARKSAGGSMDEGKMKEISENIALITGQKPALHKAKKAISNFKSRKGLEIGMSVTLRGVRAQEFIGRFVNIALPRVRDFRGIGAKFDGHGNYSVGLKDHTVFPEISPEKAEFSHGIEVTIVTTTTSDKEARLLLDKLGFPFQKKNV